MTTPTISNCPACGGEMELSYISQRDIIYCPSCVYNFYVRGGRVMNIEAWNAFCKRIEEGKK